MKSMTLCCIAWYLVGAVCTAATTKEGLSGRWVGAADLWGRPVVVELEMGTDAGTLDAYGEAPLSFDARVLEGGPVSGGEGPEGDVRLTLRLDDTVYRFEGTRVGDVLAGDLHGDGPATSLRGLRVPSPASADMGRFMGLYEGDGRRILVTGREYGGLRAIDLDSGTNDSLVEVGERGFLTHRQILEDDTARPRYRFPRNESGDIVALVRGDWSDPETLDRKPSFSQQQLRFRSGDVELAGTLLLPPGKQPVAAVVLVHGSGPIYRTALLQRAVVFVESGLGVLLYDKRGTGASGGEYRGDRFEILIDDVRAAVRAARAHPRIDASRVGLQGHSQAGFLIPVVAADEPEIAFTIVVNGGGIRPGEQSLYDKGNDLAREGFSEEERGAALDLMRRFFAYVRDREGDRVALERDYLAALSTPWFATTDLPELPGIPSWDDPPPEMLAYAAELAFDPVPYQRRMRQPVLVLLGDKDETVPASVVAGVWRDSLAANGNPASSVEIIAGANHGMRLESEEGHGELRPDYVRRQREWLASLFE